MLMTGYLMQRILLKTPNKVGKIGWCYEPLVISSQMKHAMGDRNPMIQEKSDPAWFYYWPWGGGSADFDTTVWWK